MLRIEQSQNSRNWWSFHELGVWTRGHTSS